MSARIKDYQFYIYLVAFVISFFVLVISANDVIFHSDFLSNSALSFSSLGNWDYWIFVAGVIFTLIFFYFLYKITIDMRKFEELVSKQSKYNFVKSMKDLQKIARRLGPKYERQLAAAMEKFKVK
ncbi:MAG: DUF3198 domain-containing protein [Candidatus Thermoplasmatota archaeon]|jgi:uncharacterized protein YacL|nr:DUF3198 domain-containing protein [Candidatus Thermoplasmatota archaeon]MCL5667871.1 DUF3198 domain-containing protein [Candidatus Thermoplasmatota archaeon]